MALFRDHGLIQIINTLRFGYKALRGFPELQVPYDPLWGNFYITARCNLQCEHCQFGSSRSQRVRHIFADMTLEIFVRVLDLYPGLIAIGLVGGEPLLHPRIFDMIRVAHNRRIKVHIPTNGTLIPDNVDAFLEAPVEMLNISFYGTNSETFTQVTGAKSSLFDNAIRGAEQLARRRWGGGYPRIMRGSFICTKKTMYRAFDFVRLCEELGFDQVKLKNLIPYGIPGYEESLCLYEEDPEVRNFIARLRQERFRIPVFLPRLHRHNYKRRQCSMPFRWLNIDGEGFIGPCCVEGTGRRWGNALMDHNIWNGRTMVQARSMLLDSSIPLPPLCLNCEEMNPERMSVGG